MRRLFFPVLLALTLGFALARGREFLLPEGYPLISVELPAAWEQTETKQGVEARSRDGSVLLSIESNRTDKDLRELSARMLKGLEDASGLDGNARKGKESDRTFLGLPAKEVVVALKHLDVGLFTHTVTLFGSKGTVFTITQMTAEGASGPELALLKKTLDSIKLLGDDAAAKKAKLTAAAEQVKKDLRLLNDAIEMATIEHNVKDGAAVTFTQIQPNLDYLRKKGARLGLVAGKDPLGNAYPQTYVAGQIPMVPAATAAALESVADDAFWKPYQVEPKQPAAPAKK